MNFIELCRAAASDSGTIAGLPSFVSVVGATGRAAQLVGWVRDAWIDIQNERSDWLFMRSYAYKTLVPGNNSVSLESLALGDVSRITLLIIKDPAKPDSDQSELRKVSWEEYRRTYGGAFTSSANAQRPQVWTEWQDQSVPWLAIGPEPDKTYDLYIEYIRTPQVLTLDTDIPQMPPQYHRLIQAEAIRLGARSDEAFQVLGERADMYSRLRYALVRDQTPPISIANEYIG